MTTVPLLETTTHEVADAPMRVTASPAASNVSVLRPPVDEDEVEANVTSVELVATVDAPVERAVTAMIACVPTSGASMTYAPVDEINDTP